MPFPLQVIAERPAFARDFFVVATTLEPLSTSRVAAPGAVTATRTLTLPPLRALTTPWPSSASSLIAGCPAGPWGPVVPAAPCDPCAPPAPDGPAAAWTSSDAVAVFDRAPSAVARKANPSRPENPAFGA